METESVKLKIEQSVREGESGWPLHSLFIINSAELK